MLTDATTIQSLDLPTGITMPYGEQGDPDGIPVIMLHGYSDSLYSNELMMAYLPASIRAFALTMRGHGDASKPETGYRTHDFAADIAAFMDAKGLSQAVIVGHSNGSVIAQRFAVEYPERLIGLVLLAAFERMAGNPNVESLYDEAIAGLVDEDIPGFAREFQESTIHAPLPAYFLERAISESAKLPAAVWKAILREVIDSDPYAEQPNIATRTLIIEGGKDAYISREDAERLAARIPDARLLTYDEIGHAVQWEAPERVAADVLAFINTLQ